MASPARLDLLVGERVAPLRPPHRSGTPRWSLAGLAGRLVELSGDRGSACLTAVFGIVHEAQQLGEQVAWVTERHAFFFPLDVAAGGIDLRALTVVRVSERRLFTRAADHLARSGGFGLIVVDMGAGASLAIPVQTRLLGLAQRHDVALIFLTEKGREAPSLGSLIALRGQARTRRMGDDRFACELHVLKDKRRAPGEPHVEICRGPAGLH